MPTDDLRQAVRGLMGRARDDLAELVAFRSVADPKQYPPAERDKAARWVVDAFADVGLHDVTMSATPDGSMAVHGHAPGPDGTPTVLLYCHYDVQPPLGEDAWNTPIWELTEHDGRWYGRGLMGDGSVADLLWARPSATVIGIDAPHVIGSANAVQASATARVSLRLPPGTTAQDAQNALVAHLQARVPWGLQCEIERVALGDPFVGSLEGPAFEALKSAMEEAYGRPMTTEGQGGSIPLCNVLAETYPAAMFLMGVEEPRCLIHAPNESVDPSEIELLAIAEALFLQNYAWVGR
jgi:acetylornithine deacetylase/succinyl-diaminopimelate desuccinylase-like protein